MIDQPCPFCGVVSPLEADRRFSDKWFVHCLHCHACGPTAGTKWDAIDLWNSRRQPNEAAQQRVREALDLAVAAIEDLLSAPSLNEDSLHDSDLAAIHRAMSVLDKVSAKTKRGSA